jgi:hypothetical protein
VTGQAAGGRWGRLGQRRKPDRRGLFRMILRPRAGALQDLVPLDLDRVVRDRAGGRVRPPDQQAGAADPMAAAVDGQQPGDDHRRSGRHGLDARLGADLRRLGSQQPKVHHPAGARADQLLEHHGLELLAAVEQLGEPAEIVHRRDGHGRIEGVVGLDRTAAGGVGVEQQRGRCRG